MPDRQRKNVPKVKPSPRTPVRSTPGEELLKKYDLKKPNDIFRLFERFGYNLKWCSEACGRNPQWAAAMVKRLGLQDEVRQRRADYNGRTAKPAPGAPVDAKKDSFRREEELLERIGNAKLKTKQFLDRVSEVEVEQALVGSGGCIADAAKILGVEYHILLSLVNKTPSFMDAKDRGEEEFHLEAKDMVLQCVRGARNPTTEQSKWLMFYAKSRLGMADQVTHTILDDLEPVPTSEPAKIARPKLVAVDKRASDG